MTADPTVGRGDRVWRGEPVTADWFVLLCARKGVTPAEPKAASALVVGDILFTANGQPRTITTLRRYSRNTYVTFSDDWEDSFRNGEILTLIATARSAVGHE